ncbi:MAG: hypothetical protein KA314_02670 [Chloroflexi bacterium]|nr:hypothetical protein [Chloroflexota bacterium]MBP8054712.1 hypothetical protein [Chloroflexota bacterium]
MNILLRPRIGFYLLEWFILIVAVYFYSQATLLDGNAQQLQQTGEHNESATLPILADISLRRYGDIPLWNPYMLTGFPHVGDPINHFWNPIATLPVLIWGGVNGMKVSIFLSLIAAAFGQWVLVHVLGVRGLFRLWAGLLYAFSGGLALFWRLGWYELLVGIAWFPWCFAALWWALHRRDRLSLVLTAGAIAMVITTGGGYYPFYLGVGLITLTGMALYWHKPAERPIQLRRAIIAALLALGLVAVFWLPLIDSFRYTSRDAPPDYPQLTAQPISYALINYIVGDEAWFGTNVLGKGVGYGWFYIGLLPLLALSLVPWLMGRFSWRRRALLAMLVLLLVFLLWHANPYTPVRYLYEWIPFLYIFRFPNRLLVVATVPLVAAAAVTLQTLIVWARRWWRGIDLGITSPQNNQGVRGVSMVQILNLLVLFLLFLALSDVYNINKKFAMAPHLRNQNAREAMSWLKSYDDGLYYVNLGGTNIYWDWMAYAYEMEIPVMNFRYNRRVLTMDEQMADGSILKAEPKYIFAGQDQAQPPGAQLLTNFQGVNVWYQANILPFAFRAQTETGPFTRAETSEQTAQRDGPNRVEVSGVADEDGQQLVVLVSDYPGWKVEIDGQRASLQPVNGYLGVPMLAGEHTYTFIFRPWKYDVGLGISLLTVLFCVGWVGAEWWPRRRAAAVG